MLPLIKVFFLILFIAVPHSASKIKPYVKKILPLVGEGAALAQKCSSGTRTISERDRAWESAATIETRNPDIWRLDRDGKIIMRSSLSVHSPLTFGVCGGQAVRENNDKSFDYTPAAHQLMNLIEIALLGYVSDDINPVCWTPSKIHHPFLEHTMNSGTRSWYAQMNTNPIYGLYGHKQIFNEMNVKIHRNNSGHMPNLVIPRGYPTCAYYVSTFTPPPMPVSAAAAVAKVAQEDPIDPAEAEELLLFSLKDLDGLTDLEFESMKSNADSAFDWQKASSTKMKKSGSASAAPSPSSSSSGSKSSGNLIGTPISGKAAGSSFSTPGSGKSTGVSISTPISGKSSGASFNTPESGKTTVANVASITPVSGKSAGLSVGGGKGSGSKVDEYGVRLVSTGPCQYSKPSKDRFKK